MNYELSVSAEVAAQILSAAAFYEGIQEGLGERLEKEMEALLETICANPQMFQKEFGPVRRALLRRYQQVVFYTVRQEKVVVLDVRDARRQRPDWPALGYHEN